MSLDNKQIPMCVEYNSFKIGTSIGLVDMAAIGLHRALKYVLSCS